MRDERRVVEKVLASDSATAQREDTGKRVVGRIGISPHASRSLLYEAVYVRYVFLQAVLYMNMRARARSTRLLCKWLN